MINYFIPDFIPKNRKPVFCGPYTMDQDSYMRHNKEMLASNRVNIMGKFYFGKKSWAKANGNKICFVKRD